MPIINWSDDGTSIIVDVLDGNLYDTLVVDTPNGKLCYDVEIQNNPTLGQAAVPAAATATAASATARTIKLLKFNLSGRHFSSAFFHRGTLAR